MDVSAIDENEEIELATHGISKNNVIKELELIQLNSESLLKESVRLKADSSMRPDNLSENERLRQRNERLEEKLILQANINKQFELLLKTLIDNSYGDKIDIERLINIIQSSMEKIAMQKEQISEQNEALLTLSEMNDSGQMNKTNLEVRDLQSSIDEDTYQKLLQCRIDCYAEIEQMQSAHESEFAKPMPLQRCDQNIEESAQKTIQEIDTSTDELEERKRQLSDSISGLKESAIHDSGLRSSIYELLDSMAEYTAQRNALIKNADNFIRVVQ